MVLIGDDKWIGYWFQWVLIVGLLVSEVPIGGSNGGSIDGFGGFN